MRFKKYVDKIIADPKSDIYEIGIKLDDLFKRFDLDRNPGVNPKNELDAYIDAEELINKNLSLLKTNKIPTNKLNGTLLEDYALNLLKYLVWTDQGKKI